jgi:hypothetical protein
MTEIKAIDLLKIGSRRLLIVHMLSKAGLGITKAYKSENLPGCAVQMGSVAGIIGYNVIKMSVIIKQFVRLFIYLIDFMNCYYSANKTIL